MFASIDEAVEYWKDELSYVDDAKVTGYVGGYPVVEFTINKAAWGLVNWFNHKLQQVLLVS